MRGRPLPLLLLLPARPLGGGARQACRAVSPAASDAWCDANCNHAPPTCPANLCACGGPPPPTPRPREG
eukprot:gene6382-23304_t